MNLVQSPSFFTTFFDCTLRTGLDLGNSSYFKFQDSIWDTVFWFWVISSLVFIAIVSYGAATPAVILAVGAAGAATISSLVVVSCVVAGAIRSE